MHYIFAANEEQILHGFGRHYSAVNVCLLTEMMNQEMFV